MRCFPKRTALERFCASFVTNLTYAYALQAYVYGLDENNPRLVSEQADQNKYHSDGQQNEAQFGYSFLRHERVLLGAPKFCIQYSKAL